MVRTVFPFPGGKSRLASWILDVVPEHTCFVEVFGGAAGVLMNKDASTSRVEVYNDRDRDLVQFFEVLRERPEELIAWIDHVPYAREVHERWAELFYDGYRPSDEIARAGRFFFLRYSQFGATYDSPGGFGASKLSSKALSFANKTEVLDEFAARFRDVVIENLDWAEVLEKYDGPETVFYLDPPYVGTEDYYRVDDIVHDELIPRLGSLEGDAIVSYQDLPPQVADVEGLTVLSKAGEKNYIDGRHGGAKETTERLVLNFEP